MRVTWLALEWPREGEHSGGVGRYVRRLAEQMRSLVDLTVVAYEGAQPLEGVRIVTIPGARGRFQRYYAGAWHARTQVRLTMPDLIHAHGDDFLLNGDAPIVRSFYGSSWEEARSSRGLRKLNHLVLAGGELVSKHRARLKLGIAPESVSRFNCDYVVPPYLKANTTAPTRQPADVPTVLFIGSRMSRKRGWLVERSVQAIRDSGRLVRLVVVGPEGDSALWQPWVEHESGLTDSEVAALLDSAWVLASPSLYEGFGIPLLEALDHHVRVVATANPGSKYLRELAEDSVPLELPVDADFEKSLRQALDSGPLLTVDQATAADQLVDHMTALGSPERIVSIYREALLATAEKKRA